MVAIMSEGRGYNCCCGLLVVFISLASNSAQVTFKLVNTTTPVSSNSTMSTVTPAITPTGEVDCSSHSSCDECIRDVKCYYCLKDNFCRMYPACRVLPTSECPLSEVRWGATCDGA
ncbi:pituitary tumor-transforming gene 1 protein-interacting protein-like [Branchiostoma floridae]|uniref:Pituitary tumor-transforming gene 1 protein-interacting protein-like n=1 Tax=Branchiostoma floridae TaxID=7739 RepID=A0A9J7MVC6_BRAFL|nr:pituitary tumor-transforming gene 1 protein-interacting protein-like [Branchiostoma floridae]